MLRYAAQSARQHRRSLLVGSALFVLFILRQHIYTGINIVSVYRASSGRFNSGHKGIR